MLNTNYLKSVMVKNGDTQSILASAMGLSTSRLNAKINESAGAMFTQAEISFIINRYSLTPEEATKIFFA